MNRALLPFLYFLFSALACVGPALAQYQGREFVQNKGQWPSDVQFMAKDGAAKIWLGSDRFLFQLTDFSALEQAHHEQALLDNPTLPSAIVAQRFIGANPEARAQCQKPLQHTYNFFMGQDSTRWASKVAAFQEVQYLQFYPGVDLFWATEQTQYKYTFNVAPGADAQQIRWAYSGANEVKLKKDRIQIKTAIGEIQDQQLFAYQIVDGQRVQVACAYHSYPDGTYGFQLGSYNVQLPLIIDPVLVFATYNGANSDNFGMTATYGYDASAYAAGIVYGNNFPLPSLASFDTNSNFNSIAGAYGITDVFITRYTADGSAMLWSSFLGGGDNLQGTETAHSLICDSLNNIYLFGATSSTDFPTTAGAFQPTHAGGTPNANFYFNGVYFGTQGTDFYVSKMSANGQNLLASTYVGGNANDGVNYRTLGLPYNTVAAYDSLTTNYGDQFRGEIYLDAGGSVLVASCSRSANFPTQNPFQASKSVGQDAVIFKLNPNFSALQFASFYGGNKDDAAYSVKTDTLGAILFAGGTGSNNLSGTTAAYQSNYNGGKTDGFVVKLNALGTAIQKASYVGTPNYDQVFFVEVDRNNQIFLLGQAVGGGFVVNNAPYSNPGSSQFVLKLNNSLTTNLASTVIGNGNGQINISPAAFLVDICGNVYISGWGANILQSTPLSGMPVSAGAFQATTTGFDFYLMVLQNNFNGLLYGSYLGGAIAQEHVDGGTSRFDKNGVVYQSVCGGCGGHSDFPTSQGAWSNTNNSSNCNNLVFKFDFQLIPTAEFSSSNVQGCEDLSVDFQNTSAQWDSYLWDFGNGDTTSVVFNPTVVYSTPGQYDVFLYVTDSVCLITDTAQIQILVLDSILLNLNDTINLCSSSPYLLSANTLGTANQFIWSEQNDYSNPLNLPQDSTILVSQGGWYFCQAGNGFCSAQDSVFIAFDVPLSASFQLADTIGCAPFSLVINNNSTLTSSFLWVFGNGQLDSTSFEPTIVYSQPGTYTISLTVIDSICQGTDQQSIQITVGPTLQITAPTAVFLCSSVDTLLIPTVVGAPTSIIWSSSAQFLDTLNANGQANLALIDPQNAWYYVQASNAYCSASDSVQVTLATDAFSLNGPNLVCAQAPFDLQLSGAATAQSIAWSPLSAITGPSNLASATAAISTSQYIYVEVLSAQNCLLQDSIFVNVSALNPLAVVASADPTIILPNASSQLTGLPSGNFTYTWTPTLGLSNPSIANPQATIEQTTVFTLNVSDGLCTGSDTVLIKVFDSICGAPFVFIPNAFSPNKDGQNDKLYVRGPFIESFIFRVYDRWGELVWETTNLTEGWDGTFRGKLLDPDVYDYYLQATCVGGLENIIKGNVTLIR
ncbi:MAG: gliding motility-associated C-terminal domain-containing protein [Crocinitomicaceae bacterium]|nr:gliding motility-associated C-terminal domain-containing protein [Crocinitomicaceae bacterium]MDP4867595.1 gliding motility-associated C-terminal domain-containing protein [Crocinitomicaceae bacterium]MDP4955553.1 gliding motility-associated C-terminal domain-containing protein [Crocinitomicaceae bacterium]